MLDSQLLRISGSTAADIAESVRALIDAGQLKPGDELPAVRELAMELTVNRNTVAFAYKQLAAAGHVESTRRGSKVARRDSARSLSLAEPEYGTGIVDLSFGNPDPALLPDLRGFIAMAANEPPHMYGEGAEHPGLVELARRGTDAAPTQVAIVHGAIDGLERVLLTHLKPGDRVGVEEPCFTRIIIMLRLLGLIPVPMMMDDEGVTLHALKGVLSAGVRAVIITPCAQNPTGASLTSTRADALAHILKIYGEVLIIEDDHFSRLAVTLPLSLMRQASKPRRWAVVSSTSKFFGPDLRLGYVVGDSTTVARLRDRQAADVQWVSMLAQRTAALALTDPTVLKSIVRSGKIYAKRRTALLAALKERGLSAHGVEGLHVWIPLERGEAQTAQYLLAKGWAVRTGELFRVDKACGIRVTTSTLQSEQVDPLADAIAGTARPPR